VNVGIWKFENLKIASSPKKYFPNYFAMSTKPAIFAAVFAKKNIPRSTSQQHECIEKHTPKFDGTLATP
jgi:hypothetical protein